MTRSTVFVVRRARRYAAAAIAAAIVCGPAAHATEPSPTECSGFSWDLSRELALFGEPGKPLESGTGASSAPTAELDTLYAVTTVAQAAATLPHEPGKPRLTEGARAALLKLELPTAGRYRVTIDDGSWIDVVNGAELVTSNQFQGRSSCPRFHKSVEYTLPAATPLVVQVTGSTSKVVRIAVTRVP
jgi:hypothetical protein